MAYTCRRLRARAAILAASLLLPAAAAAGELGGFCLRRLTKLQAFATADNENTVLFLFVQLLLQRRSLISGQSRGLQQSPMLPLPQLQHPGHNSMPSQAWDRTAIPLPSLRPPFSREALHPLPWSALHAWPRPRPLNKQVSAHIH